jgi:hypothetical protein
VGVGQRGGEAREDGFRDRHDRIAITPAAFEATAATLPIVTVGLA